MDLECVSNIKSTSSLGESEISSISGPPVTNPSSLAPDSCGRNHSQSTGNN